MFVHSWLTLDPLARNDTVLKVMAEEERKELQVDKVVELLQRELIEVGVDCVEGEAVTELLESNFQVLLEACEEVLVALVPFALNKHGVGIEILAKILPHITNYCLIQDIASDA